MFSFISMNWRCRPLVSYRTIVELISNVHHGQGAQIQTEEDVRSTTRPALKVGAAELAAVRSHARTRSMATGTTRLRHQSIAEP